MMQNIQKRRKAAFNLIYLFRWEVGNESEANWAKINSSERIIRDKISNIKYKQKCTGSKKDIENNDSSNKIRIVNKEYVEPFFYYWICVDPSFSPKDVFEEFQNNCEIGIWKFLNPYTYEPTEKLCYYVRFDTKYTDKILLSKFHPLIQRKIIEVCKEYKQEYVDSIISPNNVSFYTYVSISEPPCNTSGRMKSLLKRFFKTNLPEIELEYLKKRRNLDKFPWSDGNFYALSSKTPPNKIFIQDNLESIQIPDKLDQLEHLVEQLRREIKEIHNFDPYELTSNMILMYKIQNMREFINEKNLLLNNSLIFEVTHKTETIPQKWGIVKCEHKDGFYNFVREMDQYIFESAKSAKILNPKQMKEVDQLHTFRIFASHDTGMSYNGRNVKIRQKVGDYFNELIGKQMPESKDDFLILQTKILFSIYTIMNEIYTEQMTNVN